MNNLTNFKEWLMARKKPLVYFALVRVWLSYLEKNGKTDITTETITKFFSTKNKWGREYSIESKNSFIKALKVYYRDYLNQPDNVWLREKGIRPDKSIPKFLDLQELRYTVFPSLREKERVILLFLYFLGLRRDELLNCKRSQLDLSVEPPVLIVNGKGRKQRKIFISKRYAPHLKELLVSYLALEPEEKINFFNITKAQLYYLMKRCSKLLNKNIFPHMFRYSCAHYLLSKGLKINFLQTFLGHTSILITSKYTESTEDEFKEIFSA